MAVQGRLGTRRERRIHPVTWRAFRDAQKPDVLQLELAINQFVQIDTGCDHIAPENGRSPRGYLQFRAEILVNFVREKSDLAFVVAAEIEKAIAFDPAPREAANLRDFHHRMDVWRPLVVAEEIVSGRDVEMEDANGRRETHQVQANVAKQCGSLVNSRVSALTQPFSAVLLAGGKSTRMGTDKAALVVDGEPLWQRQWLKLEEIGATERFVSGPRDGPWSVAGLEVLPDQIPDTGPLAGVVAALGRAQFQWLLVFAVDLPDVPVDLLRELVRQAMISGVGRVPQSDAWLQPLAAVYPKSSLPLATECLAGSDRSMRDFFWRAHKLGLAATRPISQIELVLFRNLNMPGDLAIRTIPD